MSKELNPVIQNVIVLGLFIGVIMLTAMLDWAAEHSEVGITIRLIWLISLISLGLILPIIFMYLAGNKTTERGKSDKKWFIIAIVLFLVANGIPIIFYVILANPPGFFIFIQLALFGLIPAYFLQPKAAKFRFLIIVLLFAAIIVPIGLLVNFSIDDLWSGAVTDKTMYYLFFWGLFMVFFFLIAAIGWKLGGGSRRQSWNVFVAGTILQYSALEDLFYFFLNGQPLPGYWPWMRNFVINLEFIFGRVPIDIDIILFCIIMSSIAVLILFDVHGYIWDMIRKNKNE